MDSSTAPANTTSRASGRRGPRDLARLLRPSSIAVIGGEAAAAAIRQCRRMGYDGAIYPVHPRRSEVEGLRAFASVADLPTAPDAAFVGVNRHATIEVLRALRERGAGGAVCYASGFSEAAGQGSDLQAALVEAAGDMPVLGPNCYGLINYLDGGLLWPDQHGGQRRPRGVALVTQSSNIAINLTMNRRGLPISYLIALGNQAHVGLSDVIPALAADDRVSAVGLLIEGFDDPAGFAEAIGTARAVGLPVVALRAGRSEAGAGLALTHTASLGGPSRLASAFLDRLGVGEVTGLDAFLETLKLLHVHGPLPGRDVASLSCSGGEAILMADAGQGRDVRFRPFTPAQRAAVEATVSDLVAVGNPFDYHTFMWGDAAAMANTFAAVMRAEFDLTCLVIDLPRGDRCDDSLWRPSIEALIEARRRTGGRAALVATMAEGLPEEIAEQCMAAGVVPLIGLETALTAVATAAGIGEAQAAGAPPRAVIRAGAALSGDVKTLSEPEAKARLAAYGVPVPDGRVVPADDDGAAAIAAAREIGLPVAAKAVSSGLAHKTETGALALDLREPGAVAAAARRLAGLGDSILVERMVEDGLCEVLVGYQHDSTLGGFLVIGSGGILVELVSDSVAVPLPAEEADIDTALARLKVARLLDGYRGRPAGDRPALVRAIGGIARYCADHVDRLVELDVNPLIVRPAGQGVLAADALIRERHTREEETP